MIWPLSWQYSLGKELHLVDKLLKGWLGRSVCCGREVCYIFYLRSVLIVYH